jgi:hypothetical protein
MVFGKSALTLIRCNKKALSNLSPEKAVNELVTWTDILIRDRNNPIGNIVQGHTNLTEIKLAAELLWRVGVKPEQVALGYGFYGRAFELRDVACATPGCTFKGSAREGPCSKESGILMHYEIKAILDQAPNLKPVWDKTAAVKYLVFDKNQWVSYDDKDTFGQKIAWANSVGFGGALIWAADTDDDKFTAMSGFLDKQVNHITVKSTALEANSVTIAQTHNALAGKGCSLYKDGGCRSQKDFDNHNVRCPNGNPPIGYDKDGCGVSTHLLTSFHCYQMNSMVAKHMLIHNRTAENQSAAKETSILQNAHVSQLSPGEVEHLLTYHLPGRGSGGDCNEQCHAGEQKIHGSSWLVVPIASRDD